MNLGKPNEVRKIKDFATLTGNSKNSPVSSFKKSPKILIINDESTRKNESEIGEVKVNEEKGKSELKSNDLINKESVSQFYN